MSIALSGCSSAPEQSPSSPPPSSESPSPSRSPSPDGGTALARFVGVVDVATASIAITSPTLSRKGARPADTTLGYGGGANEVYLHTVSGTAAFDNGSLAGTHPCGAAAGAIILCGAIDVISDYSVALGNVTAVIDSTTPSGITVISAPFAYGSLGTMGTSSEIEWQFSLPLPANFTFSGHITGEVGVPDAPMIGSVSTSSSQAAVAFIAPSNNGGSPITSYTVTSSPGGNTSSGSASPITVANLVNGTSYTFSVYASNANGAGPSSASSSSVMPTGVPTAPTITSVSPSNGSVSVAFTAPSSNGGLAITGYTVTSSPAGITATGPSSPIAVTGLTNGVSYTFTMVATNAAGNSPSSAASNSVTPFTVPGAPSIAGVTAPSPAGSGHQAVVAFTAPSSNGGSAITSYTVTSSPGGFTATGSSSPLTVSGLTNGVSYTFTVVATNAAGSSSPSTASASFTPVGPPGSPTGGKVTSSDTAIMFSFVAPASNGGSAVTGYTVSATCGGSVVSATGTNSPIWVTGLTNGQACSALSVTATNTAGSSTAASIAGSVTPAATIGTIRITITSVTASSGQVSVAFTGTPRGDTVTVFVSPGGQLSSGAASPLVVTGLTNGQAYTATAYFSNLTQVSLPSAASASFTP